MSADSVPCDGRESGSILPSGLLLTDLYQLNMIQAYLDKGMTEPAVFEFFVRKLPETRDFLVAAGLEHCHVNLRQPQWAASTPFQAAALALSHTLNASV